MRRALALAGLAFALSGCPAGHEAFPDTTCTNNSDCYQGEVCVSMRCQPPFDLSVPDQSAAPADLSVLDAPGVDLGGADQ